MSHGFPQDQPPIHIPKDIFDTVVYWLNNPSPATSDPLLDLTLIATKAAVSTRLTQLPGSSSSRLTQLPGSSITRRPGDTNVQDAIGYH